MAIDRFFIAPYDKESGLVNSVRPWLISDSAWSQLNNVYCWRGRIRKRFGSRWLGNDQFSSRLRAGIAETDGSGNTPPGTFTPTDSLFNLIITPAVGQAFSIGEFIYTVVTLNAPYNLLRNDGVVATATFNAITGEVVIHGAPANTLVYYYPALPVMGLLSMENTAFEDPITIAFDTRMAYDYTGTGFERMSVEISPDASIWSGQNWQYFWGASWVGVDPFQYAFFVTNYNENEKMRSLTFTAPATYAWDFFYPQINATNPKIPLDIFLQSARILVPFHNRLVAFNTWENENGMLRHYPFRARWCGLNNPLNVNSWRQDIPGQGSGLDLPVNQEIVTVQFIKDRCIVFAERSTWELVYTGNQISPFAWQQINEELGAESTFSHVPFDKISIGIGNVGIQSCNGSNVERIDIQIPDEVFSIHQADDGIERVYGIRDYFVEMVYWALPSITQDVNFPYPNRVLTYNYRNNTWAYNDDSITVFGYIQLSTGVTWDSTTVTWDDPIPWDSGQTQPLFRLVIAGNQEGYVVQVNADDATNAPALQITNLQVVDNLLIFTVIDHNFRGGEYIYVQGVTATGNLGLVNNLIFQVQQDLGSPNTFNAIYSQSAAFLNGEYEGGGTIARVSQINMYSKEFNFYQTEGKNAAINKVDMMVDTTDALAQQSLAVNYYCSTSLTNLLSASITSGALLGQGNLETFPYALYPYENDSSRVWRSNYISAVGEVIQLQITMNNEQMTTVIPIQNPDDTFSFTGPTFQDFQLHAICFYAQPTSRLQ
jgi:hypothetical protein